MGGRALIGMRPRLAAIAILWAGLVAGAQGLHAQMLPLRWEIGVDFLAGLPQGSFGDSLDATGYGLSVHGGKGVGETPVIVGGELGFMIYGSESRREPFSPEIPDVTIDVSTTNTIVVGHFLVRVQPRHGTILPYGEGLLGVKYFVTSTSLTGSGSSDSFASTINYDDATLSYGLGGGVTMQLNGAGSRVGVLLDARIRYLWGGKARYLKEGSIRRQGSTVSYDILESDTSMLTPQAGIVIRF